MTLTHGDMRCDNVFKQKEGKGFCFIDWQTLQVGSPGIEMVQLLGASMGDPADYARMPELLTHYYRTMVAKSPAWVKVRKTEHLPA